jgi:tetratricopeptide (TPR) repeat protein
MKLISKSAVAIVLGIASLVLLLAWTQPIVHIGQSSMILMHTLGIDPLAPFSNPVYGWIAGLIASLTGSFAVYAINAFSAVCASGVLFMMFLYVYHFSRSFNFDNVFSPGAMHRVQLAAATISVLFLFAATPFTLAATRANPLMFDLLITLGAFYLVITYVALHPVSRLCLASVLYGVAMVEFTTAIMLLPVFSILMLTKMWQAGTLTFKHVLLTSGAGLAGLSLYFIQAGFFMATPTYVWREFKGFWQVVWYILVEQKQGMTGGLPRTGWLTVAMVSFLPWAITSSFRLSGGGHRNSAAMIGTLALNFMLGVLAFLLLRSFPLAPETITGTMRLFVTPYIFIALWVGNVVAFWLVVCFREKRFDRPGLKKIRRAIGTAVLVITPLYLLFMITTRSLPSSRHPADPLIQELSHKVVDMASDKEWLITNTMIDDQIAIEAHLRGLPLKILRLAYGRSPAHMKYVASLLEGDPRLQSLARVGMSPLMDEWFFHVPDVEKKTLVVHVPDMWLMAGFDAIPDQVLFAGVKAGTALALDELLANHMNFWADYGHRLVGIQNIKNEIRGMTVEWIRTHLSKVANNLGVLLEDQGRTDDAFMCYQQARELAPSNLSALMNMHVLAQREKRPEFEALEAELIKETENVMGKVQTWSLAYVYGFVRVPELFANRGITFAMSGKATAAISDMKRALSLNENNPQVQLALAGLYFGQSRDVESREQYENVLAADPGNVSALLGLMRVSVRNGEYDEARRHLEALRKTAIKPSVLKMDEAVLESLSGSPALAMSLMREVVTEQPDNMQAWAAIAITAAQMNDKVVGEEAMDKLREAKMLAPGIQLVMAQSAVDQGDRDTARRHLSEILRRQPGNIPALEMTVRLDLYEGNRDMVQRSVEKILTVDPRNALANYMLGVNHYYNQEYALAESAYRASLETSRSPQALNDLAYVLYLQGNVSDAETFVRESLGINDRNSSAWDTLGVILMEQNKLPEAEEALQKSLGLRPNTSSVMLSLAVLYEKNERWEESGRIANDINTRLNELSPQDQSRLQRLIDRLAERAETL